MLQIPFSPTLLDFIASLQKQAGDEYLRHFHGLSPAERAIHDQLFGSRQKPKK